MMGPTIRSALLVAALGHPAACGEDGSATPSDAGDAEVYDVDETAESVPMCDPAYGAVEPTPDGNVVYGSWTRALCLDKDPAWCSDPAPPALVGLLKCEAVEGSWAWHFGSSAFRVMGREDDTCVVDWLHEVEGAAVRNTCRIPLPMTPWEGLAFVPRNEEFDAPLRGVEAFCVQTDTCSMLVGGDRECLDLVPRPPICGIP